MLNLAIVAKHIDSPLNQYIQLQFKKIEWIKLGIYGFDEIESINNSTFLITLLEDTSYKEIIKICEKYRTASLKTIYLSLWENRIILGPTHFPNQSAGADSSFLFLKQESSKQLNDKNELINLGTQKVENSLLQNFTAIFHTVIADLLQELTLVNLNKPDQKLKLVDNIAIYKLNHKEKIKSEVRYIHPVFEKNDFTGEIDSSSLKLLLSKYLNSKSQIYNQYFVGNQPSEDEYKNIAIVGGGTAGYLTALSLKNIYPNLPVTLIESAKIPVIGVGEATTPEIRRFLFDTLKFSPKEFYEKVKPTWKLGIKFFWGLPGDHYFNYPFGLPDPRSAFLFDGHINNSSLTSILMNQDSGFIISTKDKNGDEQFTALDDLFYALHIENKAFIGFLKEKANEMGIEYIDDLIVDAEKKGDSNEINAIIGETGKRYKYDFFVDCTGFKSLLIEKVLGSGYYSYKDSLFTNTAVTGWMPNNDIVKPYTSADTMDSGWCWNTPLRGEDHLGYVFSSNHCSIEKAVEEFTLKNPKVQDIRTVKYISGRHNEICIGNVFAIGNSFGFVEPLESTGIHMILKEVEVLTKNFEYLKKSPSIRKLINASMNGHWDYLRDFLSIHYKYNTKLDTKFWKDCNEYTDITSIQWLIDLYHEIGLLSYADHNFIRMIEREIKDDIFGLVGFDVMLLGQGIIPKKFKTSVRNKSVWDANSNIWNKISEITKPSSFELKYINKNLEKRWLKNT